jgi:3-methyladenine DNA glycosylase/8-oxoguanine DNA glycosylase
MALVATIALRGAGGEPVDLRRTLLSHGVAELPPLAVDGDGRRAVVTLATPEGPRTVRLSERATGDGRGTGPQAESGHRTPSVAVEIVDAAPPPSDAGATALAAAVRRMLCLDDDLTGFYAACADDPALSWACRGAGRLLRSPTVFEDVVKTVCTTNCAWSATARMIDALVGRLGDPAPGAPPDGVAGRAFPAPHVLATADDAFFRDVARAGYRGDYLRRIAALVADGVVDLETLFTSRREDLPDEEVERRLLALPGVGPYAAAHVMLLLSRHSRLVLDSWTRPKYARLMGRPAGRFVADRTIVRRFRRYGGYAGLAFWLVLTRDWVDDAG